MATGPTEEQRLLLSEVELGLEIEKFLRGPIGIYLLERSKDQADEAMAKLKVVKPENTEQIREIQTEIWRCDSFEQWLRDAILNGRNAEEQLTIPPGDE